MQWTFGPGRHFASPITANGTTLRLMSGIESKESWVNQVPTAIPGTPCMPEGESEWLRRIARGAIRDCPKHAGIYELFSRQVETQPGAVALIENGMSRTYRELDIWAGEVAATLADAGVVQGSVVGLLLDRGATAIAAMLGILRIGGIYMPLHPRDPAARCAELIREAGAQAVICSEAHRVNVPASIPAVDINRLSTKSVKLPMAPGGNKAACILFTSGSSGAPKAVEVTHRGIARLVFAQDYAPFGPEQTVLHLAPLSFDASTFEIWGSLLRGGRQVIYPEGALDLAKLGRIIREECVTLMWLNASLFNVIIDEQPGVLEPVQQLLIGGEVLSMPHVRRAQKLLPSLRISNGYGPTENTTFSTWYPIPADLPADLPSIPIGYPLVNSAAYVLDEHMRQVPMGTEGEIYVGGDGVALGYRNRPELTAEKFVPDPFDETPGARLYRTGDRGAVLPDGALQFRGRADDQVKIRGFRIEPGEIEAVALEIPGVRGCAVVTVDDRAVGKSLVAFIAGESSEEVLKAVSRAFQERLPAHMQPLDVIVLDALPLTAHGKCDRRALAALADARRSAPLEAPRTAREAEVLAIFRELLGRDHIGIHDDFIALGGHSLMAVRLASRIQKRFGCQKSPCEILRTPTVRDLAASLGDSEGREDDRNTRSVVPVPRRTDLPLTHAQQRIWLIQSLHPESAAYTFEAKLRFSGNLDVMALKRALSALVQRHEILRTTFPTIDGLPVQKIHAQGLVQLDERSLNVAPDQDREAAVEQQRAQFSRQPLDLERLPLIHWALLEGSKDEHILLHREHHLLHDGWSFFVLLNDLIELYRAEVAGREPDLPALRVQLADFAVAEQAWVEQGVFLGQLRYWKERLAGSPAVLELPTDHPRPAMTSYRGDSLRFELDPKRVRGIRELAAREGATFFMAMLAPFAALLGRITGSEDLCIGTGVANRSLREIEPTVGMIINNVVLRFALQGEPTLRELLRQCREVVLGAIDNQDVPFDLVVRETGVAHSENIHPLFQVMFSAIEGMVPDPCSPGLRLKVEAGLPTSSAKFDLNITLISQKRQETPAHGDADSDAEQVTLIWESSADVFSRESAQRLAECYFRILERYEEGLDVPLKDLRIMTAEEEQWLPACRGEALNHPQQGSACGLVPQKVEGECDRRALRISAERLIEEQISGVETPHTQREVEVLAIFQDLLDRRGIGIHDDFYALGGHSLLIVRLASRISRLVGHPVDIKQLCRHPSVHGICNALEQNLAVSRDQDHWKYLMRLQPEGAGRPVFFIPGAGGDDGAVAFYARLANYVPDRPFIGFRSISAEGGPRLLQPDVAALARGFVDEILECHAADSYDIAGGCNGGVIAFEVACELIRRGKAVRRLVLLDTTHPSIRSVLRYLVRAACVRIRQRMANWLRIEKVTQGSKAKRLYHLLSSWLPVPESEADPGLSLATLKFDGATRRHRLGRFPGRLHLVVSREFTDKKADCPWRKHASGRLEVRVVPGTHYSYIREHLGHTGAAFREALEEAD
jgi:amino acid adenylation domain-containing protein